LFDETLVTATGRERGFVRVPAAEIGETPQNGGRKKQGCQSQFGASCII
jgi:hypothetical protein